MFNRKLGDENVRLADALPDRRREIETFDDLLAIHGKIVAAVCRMHRGEITLEQFEEIRDRLDPDGNLVERMKKALT